MSLDPPLSEPRCLLCDAVIAESNSPTRPAVRCRECGKMVYADTTQLGAIVPPQSKETPSPFKTIELLETPPVVPQPDADSKATPRAMEPVQAIILEDEPPVVQPRAKQPPTEPPVVQPRSSTPNDDLPEAAVVVPRAQVPMKMPEWATRGTETPARAIPRAPTVTSTGPILLPSIPEVDRPKPQLAKALIVAGTLFALTILAFGVLFYAIMQGLKMKKKAEAPVPVLTTQAAAEITRES